MIDSYIVFLIGDLRRSKSQLDDPRVPLRGQSLAETTANGGGFCTTPQTPSIDVSTQNAFIVTSTN